MSKINKAEVGERIRRIRLEMGYSQPQFAEMIDKYLSRATVSSWEHGRYLPKAERLSEIAFQGQMSVDELLYGKFCTWSRENNRFKTTCEIETTAWGEGYKYCPFCGKHLKIL